MWLYKCPQQLLWIAPQLVRCYSKDKKYKRSMFKRFQVSIEFQQVPFQSSLPFVFAHLFLHVAQGNVLRCTALRFNATYLISKGKGRAETSL